MLKPAANVPVDRHETIDSTMDEARRRIQHAESPLSLPRVIVAESQTGGRGRFARPWVSPAGGVWCTLIWPLDTQAVGILETAGLAAGLATADAIEEALWRVGVSSPVQIKWPNDLLVDSRKVAGVLCETAEAPAVSVLLAGVGINCNFDRTLLPDELQDSADTLQSIAGRPADRDALLESLIERLCKVFLAARPASAVAVDVRKRLAGVGVETDITLPDGNRIRGALVGLDDSGRAIVRTEDGERLLPSGSAINAAGREPRDVTEPE